MAALAATMALLLVSRSVRAMRLPLSSMAQMALIWTALIAGAAAIATWLLR